MACCSRGAQRGSLSGMDVDDTDQGVGFGIIEPKLVFVYRQIYGVTL